MGGDFDGDLLLHDEHTYELGADPAMPCGPRVGRAVRVRSAGRVLGGRKRERKLSAASYDDKAVELPSSSCSGAWAAQPPRSVLGEF